MPPGKSLRLAVSNGGRTEPLKSVGRHQSLHCKNLVHFPVKAIAIDPRGVGALSATALGAVLSPVRRMRGAYARALENRWRLGGLGRFDRRRIVVSIIL
jgi:hypothetical protein